MDHVDHILIVDDDREIRELVGNYLKKNGLRTTVVADGRQMRAFLETTPVDLIVLDIMMPGTMACCSAANCAPASTRPRRC